MLRQASVSDIRKGLISRNDGYLVITMRHYPRGVSREIRDEYIRALSPQLDLFTEFKEIQRSSGDHNHAFAASHYEERFGLTSEGWTALAQLVDRSHEQDVYMVCQCKVGEKCHRELVLMIARDRLGAEIAPVLNRYPLFEQRLNSGDDISA